MDNINPIQMPAEIKKRIASLRDFINERELLKTEGMFLDTLIRYFSLAHAHSLENPEVEQILMWVIEQISSLKEIIIKIIENKVPEMEVENG